MSIKPIQSFNTAPPPSALLSSENQNLIHQFALKTIIETKEAEINRIRENRWDIGEVILVGGDYFSWGYLGMQTALIWKKSLENHLPFGLSFSACGIAAGVINMAVAGIEIFQAIQTLKNNNWSWKGDAGEQAKRLLLDALIFFLIGVVMCLVSISSKAFEIGALAAVGAFFTKFSWILPILYFIAAIPTIKELSYKYLKIQKGEDFGTKIAKEEGSCLKIEEDPNNPLSLEDALENWSRLTETLQAEIGVEAAVEVLKLKQMEFQKADTSTQKQRVNNEIREWRKALKLRGIQQAAYALGAVSGGISSIGAASKNLTIVSDGLDAFANAEAAYLDTRSKYLFKRNVLKVVKEAGELLNGKDKPNEGEYLTTSAKQSLKDAFESFQKQHAMPVVASA